MGAVKKRSKKDQIFISTSAQHSICYLLICMLLFITFFSFTSGKLNLILLPVSIMLMLLQLDKKIVYESAFSMLLCFGALLLLAISGRWGERGFNAPIAHAYKFLYIFFVQTVVSVIKKANNSIKQKMLFSSYLAIMITCIISIYYVKFVEVNAIRYASTFGMNQIVAGFDQVYAVPVLASAFYGMMLYHWKKLTKKTACILMLVIFSFFLLCSHFTTAFLLFLIGIFLNTAIFLWKRKKRLFVLLFSTGMIACLFMILFSDQFAGLLYSASELLQWEMRARIRGLIDLIFGTSYEKSYSMDRRNELADYSLQTFKEHPVFGVQYEGYGYGVIGSHQEWVDLLGVFGLTGAVLFVLVMLILIWSVVKSMEDNAEKGIFACSLVQFVILGFLNPCLSTPVLLSVFVVAPNILLLPKKLKNSKRSLGL